MPVPVEGSQLQEEEGENAVVKAGGGAGRGAAKGGATAGGEEGRLLLERAGAGLPAVGPKDSLARRLRKVMKKSIISIKN